MKNKIAKILVLSFLIVASFFNVFISHTTYATNGLEYCNSVSEEVKEAAGCTEQGTEKTFGNVIKNILSAVILMAGFVAVVFIIIGGVQYMTSSGEPTKIKKAKDTILYALIGLIVCALSFAIVNWAVGIINENTGMIISTSDSLAFLIK